ncbi:MAG: dihydropteroate synthase [Clostridiales bacterium]|nr:dihydropteroate synthase [Clostridiales bacterium]
MHYKGKRFDFLLDRTLVMGILNATPDSFSDGGAFNTVETAIARARQIEDEGGDIIDIGAQSTRPGFTLLPAEEELRRLMPILQAVRAATKLPISIDTFYPQVAEAALLEGADIINDVGGCEDERMLPLIAEHQAACVIMRPRGVEYHGNVVEATRRWLQTAVKRAEKAGIPKESVCLDPGIGFDTDYKQSLKLIRETGRIRMEGTPYLVGLSRKRVVGEASGDSPAFDRRLGGTIAADVIAQWLGANIVRVHDVYESVQAARMTDALLKELS